MKKCTKCKQEKGFEGFYKDKSMGDGYNCTCKACRLIMDRERRATDPAWVERRRLQNELFHKNNAQSIAERKKVWASSEAGKQSKRLSCQRWKPNNRHKIAAHREVEKAIRNGILTPKTTCEFCGSSKQIEGHHADYSKPLVVLWICKVCHNRLQTYEKKLKK